MKRKAVSETMLTLLLVTMLFALIVNVPIAKAGVADKASETVAPQDYSISSVPPPTEWNKTYGGPTNEAAISVVQTSDGGYSIAGTTYSYVTSSPDFWLAKTDSAGNMLWNRRYGGKNREEAFSMVQTSDGGYAIVGEVEMFGWLSNIWLVKTDSAGNMQWNKTYAGPEQDGEPGYAYAYSIVQAGDQGYALAGRTWLGSWLVKTDSTGSMQWNKTYGLQDALSIVQTTEGGYAIAGYTGAYPNEDFWLAKTDSAGNMQWNKTYGGAVNDFANSVVQTFDGGYALAGYTYSYGAGASDFWLVKTDASGNKQWDKTYGGTSSDRAFSLVQTRDGGYAIAGDSYGVGLWDIWLVRTGSTGNMLWNLTYGGAGSDMARSVIQTSDGGYAIAGETSSFGAGLRDFWLIKIAPGKPVALFTYTIGAGGYDVTFDASGSYDPEGVIVSYGWDLGDGTIIYDPYGTGKIVTHRYNLRRVYSVKLTVLDNEGLTGTITRGVSLGNLEAQWIEPLQVVDPWGWELVEGKYTDFRIRYRSTFDVSVGSSFTVDAGGFTPNTYTFSYNFAPGTHEFVIGNVISGSPFFKPIKNPYTKAATYKLIIDPYNSVPETDETDNSAPGGSAVFIRTVKDTKPLRVLFVPVRFDGEDGWPRDFNGFNTTAYAEHGFASIQYIKATYPLAESEISWDLAPFSAPVNAGPRPTTEADANTRMEELIRRLAQRAGNNYDRVVGLVRDGGLGWFAGFPDDPTTTFDWRGIIGFAMPTVSPRAVLVTLGWWKTTPHEIGHTYDLGHSNANGAGYYVLGRRAVNAQTFMSTGAIPNPPAQPSHRRPVSPVPNFWIRDNEYQTLLNRLTVTGDPEILLVTGTFYSNGTVVLDDWYRYPSGIPDYNEGSVGNYYIVQLDSFGIPLSAVGFNVTYEGEGELEGLSFDHVPVAFTIPFAIGTKTVEIYKETGELVATKTLSDNPPWVGVITPNGGETLTLGGPPVQVSWLAFDPDGDPMVYDLLISKDRGTTWIPIETGLTDTTYNLSLTGFSGGNQYMVKVIATDGANTGEDTSDGPFTIASFTISVDPSEQTIPLGGKANYTLNITSYGGFSNPITLNASSPTTDKLIFRWPNGSTIFPVPNNFTTTVVEVEVPYATEAGAHTLLFSGTGSNTQVAIADLFVSSHDLAVTDIKSSKTIVGQGFSMTINVTIQNQGNFGETFTVNIHGNQTSILNQSTYLPPRNSTILTFTWNTSGFAKGNYTLSAYAWPVPGETDTTDNTYTNGNVIVAMIGDITGPTQFVPDGKVDIRDIALVAKYFGQNVPPAPANCDITGPITGVPDNKIDIRDIATIAIRFGQIDP